MSERWRLLIDFDGTLTERDADFVIADAALGPAREGAYRPLAEAFEALQISTRQFFEGYLEIVGLTPEGFASHAHAVPLRSGLASLVAFCRERGVELHVVTEGLDVYVNPVLARMGLEGVPLSANRAIHLGEGRYEVAPGLDAESCERCLSCKGAHARRARAAGYRVALVGNGASDLCGAREADLVFARDTLLAHCQREGLAHESWLTFEDVRRVLARHL